MGIEERVESVLCSDRYQWHRDGESATLVLVVVEEVGACFDAGACFGAGLGIAFGVVDGKMDTSVHRLGKRGLVVASRQVGVMEQRHPKQELR